MIKKYEELSAAAWPAIHTKLYDGWVLRFSDGYTRRSNSVIPLYQSTIPADEKIDICEREYSARNLPVIFKISPESYPEDLDRRLEERGYTREYETALRVLELDGAASYDTEGAVIEAEFSDSWVNGFFECSGKKDPGVRLTARKILDNVPGKVICVSKQIDGKVAGCGYGAIDRDCVGIFDIIVREDYRQKGCAKDMIYGILGTAYSSGIKKAYLQVLSGNFPAENLYNKLGFKEIYRYWYRKKAIITG